MALYANSRYADQNTSRDVMLVRPDGVQTRTLYRRPAQNTTTSVIYYVWRAGDRIDRLAAAYLGDPTLYWKIMDINPEVPNAAMIEPGTQIRIPRA